MNLRHQTSILTKQKRGGITHAFRYSFFVRVILICVLLMGLMVLTIGTYQGTENLMAFADNMYIWWNT